MDVSLVSLALAALDALKVRPDRRRTALRLPRDLGHQLADDRGREMEDSQWESWR